MVQADKRKVTTPLDVRQLGLYEIAVPRKNGEFLFLFTGVFYSSCLFCDAEYETFSITINIPPDSDVNVRTWGWPSLVATMTCSNAQMSISGRPRKQRKSCGAADVLDPNEFGFGKWGTRFFGGEGLDGMYISWF